MNVYDRWKMPGRSGWVFLLLALTCSFWTAGGDIKVIPMEVAPELGKVSRATVEGASLKTDAEANDLLARAEQFAKQGRYDLASKLWQTVIDSSNDLMFTRDEWIERTLEHEYQRYRSVSGDIETTLANLPREGLKGYRVQADAEAKLTMERPGAKDSEAALAEVVRRYFLSSLGDDAAFDLACRKLDRYEFLPAIRLLDKIINDYPSPTVEKDLVLLRLAALNARVGDPDRALKIVTDLRARVTPAVPDNLLNLVEADIRRPGRIVPRIGSSGKLWPMVMGSPGRGGLMRFPELLPQKIAATFWSQPYELNLPEAWPELPADGAKAIVLNPADPFGRGLTRGTTARKPSTPEAMNDLWPKHGWFPSARVLFHSGNIYFKTHNRLVCADAQSGELLWLGFRNSYPSPAVTVSSRNNAEVIGRDPLDVNEIQNFADSINQSMCIVSDKVLTIQGTPIDFTEERASVEAAPVDPMVRRRMIINRGAGGASRMRDNRLVAYQARNGKLQWMRSANEPGGEVVKKSCFAGPPVPYAGLVLVPVLEGNGMYLVAIDSEGGATQWRTFLGDEPASGSARNGAIIIAVDGGEAYVATGAGLVFSVDAISGSMNWAVSYPRTTEKDPVRAQQLQRFGAWGGRGMGIAKFDGWHEEMIVSSGNAVIVTPTDFNHVVALDRRSGSLLWESARSPGDADHEGEYALGVHKGRFYAAGNDVVRCYRISGGRMLWEATYDAGHGRGALTAKGVFVPAGKNRIIQLSLEDGTNISKLELQTFKDQPIGNLYSNGNRLYGAGLRRVYAIGAPAADEIKPEEKQENAGAGEPRGGESLVRITAEADILINELFARMTSAYARGAADFSGLAGKFESLAGRLVKISFPEAARQSELLADRKGRYNEQETKLEELILRQSATVSASETDAVRRDIKEFKGKVAPTAKVFRKYGIEIP